MGDHEERSIAEGLSPRVRGNLLRRFDKIAYRRSIPACAGEPAGECRRRVPLEVYPRVCGGTVSSWCVILAGWGLSPRVRGNQGVVRP